MKSTWTIEFDRKALVELKRLDSKTRKRIADYLGKRVQQSENPRLLGKRLQGTLKEYWRFRVGDYRILCKIEDDRLVVLVIRIAHRKKVYD